MRACGKLRRAPRPVARAFSLKSWQEMQHCARAIRSDMKPLNAKTLKQLWHDADAREERLREIITERMALAPPPVLEDSIVASYFFAFRTQTLKEAAPEISYHATSGIKHPPPGSLLEQCTSKLIGVDAFDRTGRMGL